MSESNYCEKCMAMKDRFGMCCCDPDGSIHPAVRIGARFQYRGFKAWWEVVQIVDRGIVVQRRGDGSHKHLLETKDFDAVINTQ